MINLADLVVRYEAYLMFSGYTIAKLPRQDFDTCEITTILAIALFASLAYVDKLVSCRFN